MASERFTVRESRLTGEKVYYTVHPTGAKIAVCPKPEYNSAYAVFGTRYGSIDNDFSVNGGEFTRVPDGIAHYLEHKLFENEDCGAFERYAKTGACANAFTSFDKTYYLFSCSQNFEQSLEILLDFVQAPYFTPETVQKEQGIIGQEIRMYDDNPGWRVYFNLMGGMYKQHPIRVDIAGTVESIANITADLLYQCYNTFYNLNNMAIAVAGNVDPDTVLEICDRMLKSKEKLNIERRYPEDDGKVVTDFVEQHFDVSIPEFQLGFKEIPRRLTDRELVLTNIISDAVFGTISDFYRRMTDKGLINPSFGSEYLYLNGAQAMIFSGQSADPEQLRDEIIAEIKRVKAEGIDPELFECARRNEYADMLSAYNNTDDIANGLADDMLFGTDSFKAVEAAAEVTVEEGSARFREQFDTDNFTLSVVRR